MAALPPSPAVVLRRRRQELWFQTNRTLRAVSTIGLAALGVISLLTAGWSWLTIVYLSMAVMLFGGQLVVTLVATFSIVASNGELAVKIPLRSTRVLPVASVAAVIEIPLKTPRLPSQLRSIFVLIDNGGSTLALLAPRSYQPGELGAFLALLPPVQHTPDPRTMREIRKSFPVGAPLSRVDVGLFAAANVLVYAGMAGIVTAVVLHHGVWS